MYVRVGFNVLHGSLIRDHPTSCDFDAFRASWKYHPAAAWRKLARDGASQPKLRRNASITGLQMRKTSHLGISLDEQSNKRVSMSLS
ncbi:uncharacterized protein UV8b_07949 [Ustilaginoidea virens]|uniref:Uncharacterized protein n=1 Tax=Ustilaginoidea virens TaxID=1159556 RepID=A0A8E5HYM6_USTVR|nr:uncharacterized protein UV8b_07949 [Ustilaginoidea virens]QUC23708.1 hypothetical protein UV8b_07949 [Ustilaginoidea virens]